MAHLLRYFPVSCPDIGKEGLRSQLLVSGLLFVCIVEHGDHVIVYISFLEEISHITYMTYVDRGPVEHVASPTMLHPLWIWPQGLRHKG